MREKLASFNNFAVSLLPTEVEYLQGVEKFDDADNKRILYQIKQLTKHPNLSLDEAIDKRKYSRIKNWINSKLADIDIDIEFSKIQNLEEKVYTDNVLIEDEKAIKKMLVQYNNTSFHFSKFYKMLLSYRHFLLIRMRYKQHDLVENFINRFARHFQISEKIYADLHTVTKEVVTQYTDQGNVSPERIRWLSDIFYDRSIDKYNRFLAFVRLIFLHFNFKLLKELIPKMDYFEDSLKEGTFYSKNIVLNFYSNRLLLHTRLEEWEKAVAYGYLSIKQKNRDYLLYLNNFVSLLMRLERHEDAAKLLKEGYVDFKESVNFHSKIGFISLYIFHLNHKQRYKEAVKMGSSFFNVYKKEVLRHRWHFFFSAFFEALCGNEDFDIILKYYKRNKLQSLIETYQNRPNYIPVLKWYFIIASFKEGSLNKTQFKNKIADLKSTFLIKQEKIRAFKRHLTMGVKVAPSINE